MKYHLLLLSLLTLSSGTGTARAGTAYGSLNNFDVVNDTGDTCYGFEIELEDLHSTDVTYTYDYNHYGTPRITEDNSVPGHPKVRVRYEAKKNPDGTWASFTNPQDPLHPLAPTDGHAFTNPSLNLGGEHFGMGYYGTPSVARYHWLVEDPASPGTLMLGPSVQVATPQFVYQPPINPPVNPGDPPAAPAQIRAVIVPHGPENENDERFGEPVWVKIFKTVQPSGKKVKLEDLVTDDPQRADDRDWAGEEQPETEIEWMVFQKRPASDPEKDEIEAKDDLKNGDEIVTRRYEFYVYQGPINPEDGEAKCSKPERCPDSVGAYLGAQMAGFGAELPLGLIQNLQSGVLSEAFVDRTLVAGGEPPYSIRLSAGALPAGMTIDTVSGILSGTPTESGEFPLTVEAIDSKGTIATQSYRLKIELTEVPTAQLSIALEDGEVKLWLSGTARTLWQLQRSTTLEGPWQNVGASVALPTEGAVEFQGLDRNQPAYFRAVQP